MSLSFSSCILLALLQLCSCISGPPRIQLTASPQGSYTIHEGETFTAVCHGIESVQWRFPDRHLNCYDNATGSIASRTNVTTVESGGNYFSTVVLTKTSYLDTGFVECYYTSSNPNDIVNVDRRYLFVNSSIHLLMPCSRPNELCQLPSATQRVSVPVFLKNYNDFAPCKPTSGDLALSVRVKSSKQKLSAYFDYSRGFQLLNATGSSYSVECIVEGKADEKCWMSLSYASADPMCSLRLSKTVNAHESYDVLEQSDVTLTCEALCALLPTGYSMTIQPEDTTLPYLFGNLTWDMHDTFYRVRSELIITNVSRSYSGLYSCNFSSPTNSSQVVVYPLTVKEPLPPDFIVDNPAIQHFVFPSDFNETRAITLDCVAFGTPAPTYKWFNESAELVGEAGSDRLVLTAGFDAVGNFTCMAENSYGAINRTFSVLLYDGETIKVVTLQHNELAGWLVSLIIAVCVGVFLTLVAVGGFGYYRIRRRNRSLQLKALWTQYFSGDAAVTIGDSDSVASPRTMSTSVAEGDSFDDMLQPSELWLSDLLQQIPYKDVYEVDISKFKFIEPIGKGTFGVVYKAELRESNDETRIVAVKSIRDGYDLEQYAALCSEIKLLSAIGHHLNIANLIGAVTKKLQDGVLFMVVELCTGGNLKDFLNFYRNKFVATESFDYFTMEPNDIVSPQPVSAFDSADDSSYVVAVTFDNTHSANTGRNVNNSVSSETEVQLLGGATSSSEEPSSGLSSLEAPILVKDETRDRLSSRDLIIFAYQIASGMEFLHSRHCLHRDLAARNILISSGNVLKISDFGLAKDVYKYGGQYTKKRRGKLPFKTLAPESIRYKMFSKATDVWGYGVLLWEMFTLGMDPYPEVTTCDEGFLKLLLEGYRLPRPEYANESITDLMYACWHEDSLKRPDFAFLKDKVKEKLPLSVVNYYRALYASYTGAFSSCSSTKSLGESSNRGTVLPSIVEEVQDASASIAATTGQSGGIYITADFHA